jgi:hypothetical protein
MIDIHRPMRRRPPYAPANSIQAYVPRTWYVRNDESVLIARLALDRRLFGEVYSRLMPDFFQSVARDTGVMICARIQTKDILKGRSAPGDIDLLVLPYAGNDLMLSQAMAIEVKAVRATFANPGKSPGGFGFTQASALLECGFPYVAALHLIVSDRSPPKYWREILVTEIVDSDTGECGPIRPYCGDTFPSDLIRRSIGRLEANCADARLGLAAAYIDRPGIWMPSGRPATLNAAATTEVVTAIGDYFDGRYSRFLDTPRFPPNDRSP